MIPLAPPRLSTTTCCPSCSVSFWLTIRARMSGEPPGGEGTMKRIGFVGYACALAQPYPSHKPQAASSKRSEIRFSGIVVPCDLWLVACGLWLVACGLWLVACGLWLVACGLWLVA